MKKPSFTKSLIALLLFFSPYYLFSQTFFAASTAVPTDGNAHAGPTATLTPPLSMVTNDLTVVYAEYRATGVTPAISGGGQAWNTATIYSPAGSSQTTAIFWCTFNGTWVGGGPTVTVGVGNTLALTAVMYVFHPNNSSHVWGVNAVGIDATSTGAINTIAGVTTTMPNTVNMGFWGVAANNTWGTLSGTWTKPGSVQYRNTTTAQSSTAAFRILATAGPTGSPAQTQAGTTAATVLKSMVSWNELANDDCSGAISLTPGSSCTNTAGNVGGATLSSGIPAPTCGTPVYDVWYKFTAASTTETITISGTTNFVNPGIQLLSGACGSLSTVACATGSVLTTGGLTIGTTYYVRVYSTSAVPATGGNFNICIVDGPPANDNCANASSITTATSCIGGTSSLTSQTLYEATTDGGSITSNCTAANNSDVWYKFVAQSVYPTITVSNLGASWTTRLKVQLLSGSCGSFTEVGCGNNTGPSASFSINPYGDGLTIGTTYYIRIYKNNAGVPTGGAAAWAFDICVTDPSPAISGSGRMVEVFQQSILSPANVLNYPWEVTYGPDNKLWVTEAHGYKAYRIDPNTGARTTILDVSNGSNSSELTAGEHTTFNVQFPSSQSPWPQGGFAGLALHPKFLDPVSPKNYVYISYVGKYDSSSVIKATPGGDGSVIGGTFFKNYIVRFTYNTVTGKLESPVALCDTLPGSSDHNSQRIIIAPVSGTYYLFYGQGDMGAGQFGNQVRTNKAQNPDSYQGKILRFNLETDGDAGTLDKWIPNDNPYNGAKQSAVWAMGIRNNQGFAYDTSTNMLYGSTHGPFSDDEINIIEPSKNYGHPYVEGFAADGNYNGITAGTAPNMTNGNFGSACPTITDEVAAAAAIGPNYRDPLFSAYTTPTPVSPSNYSTMTALWNGTNGSNNIWPSEGWSGLDLYSHTLIPGWKRSLVAAGLKWGRLIRLKLGPTGTTTLPSNLAYGNTGDTVTYFQSTNRYRDLAFAPNGKDIYVIMDNSSATSGPGIGNPVVPACKGCLVKYTFLGYADASGESTIPTSIDVTDGTVNTVDSATTITIDNTNNNLWVPITGPDGNIMAEIYPNGNNLGIVRSAFYKNSGAIRTKSGIKYLDRNITITPEFQPSSAVKIRLYISKAEFDALDADPLSGVSAITDLKILKNEDPCSAAIASSTSQINPTFTETHGANGYMLQGNISNFSSFYFASSNIMLPLNLLSFKGSLQNNNTLLEWETANEVNTSKFVIERSIDGHNFQQIGTTDANGTANKNKYSFIDYEASHQSSLILYYRLKMLDLNGGFTYSDVVVITLPSVTSKVTVFPNPASKQVMLNVSTPADGKVQWSLTDNAGRIVIQNSAEMKKGNNSVSINISHLSTGFYYLSITGAGIDQKVKLEKL